MNISLKTVPHNKQRYETVGDWIVAHGTLKEIRVSDMHDEDYHFFVAIHELIEAYLCLAKGISQHDVDAFDKDYERAREKGVRAKCGCKPSATSEPGHDRHAPYGKYHDFATKIEKMIVKARGRNWNEYDKTVLEL